MNKQQLASKIWQSANKMRSKIEASEYKDYILGFIFYKFLSDKEVKFLRDNGSTDEEIRALTEPENNDDSERIAIKAHIQKNLGYFISYENLFSTWLEMGANFGVKNVRDALSAFDRLISQTHKKVFDRIFETLQTGLSKLGDSAGAQTKAISGLIKLIKDIPMDAKQDYDVLGFIYEYLISNFAANAGKKAGEFYTPHEVSLLMSEIVAHHLRNKTEIKIYDPTSGSGSLLINIGRSVAKHIANANNIKYYAQEWKENTYNLTRMNLVMRGILPDNIVIRCGDTLEEDWPFFEENDRVNSYYPLYVNAVVSNPPYSQAWDPKDKDSDKRYKDFGLAPKSKADYAFLLHDLFHLQPDGIMTIVLPHGVLFRGDPNAEDGEGKIRKQLIERNHIDAIIGLPSNIFFGTGIATIIMVLKQQRNTDDVLFIDASRGYTKKGKNNQLRASDIKKIVDTYIARADALKYSAKVPRDVIRGFDYNLNIPRYVDSADEAENWDIYATMFGGIPKAELGELKEVWEAFPSLQAALFADNGTPYVSLAAADIKAAIESNTDVRTFLSQYSAAFADFYDYLKSELIGKLLTLNITKQESIISDNIFTRLQGIPLVDKYKAYQALNDEWVKIATDLEIIQTEGAEAIKVVDPNMVVKKKDGEEAEEQDGYKGRILPFDLVQGIMFAEEKFALVKKENRLGELAALITDILESLSDEDKDTYKDALNENGDAFATAGLAKLVKQLKKDGYAEDTVEASLVTAFDLMTEAKTLKAEVKMESAALHMSTKAAIENLSDGQALNLLEIKWLEPIESAISNLPKEILSGLVSKIKALADKYATTYTEVAEKITDAESEIIKLINDLTGDSFDMQGLAEFQKLLKGE